VVLDKELKFLSRISIVQIVTFLITNLKNMNLTDIEDLPIDKQWDYLLDQLGETLGSKPADLNGVLFLIGVQELGQGAKRFTKEQKQDLMHIGICKVLSLSSYYVLERIDAEGWPHYMLNRALPQGTVDAQEMLLKMHVIEYFKLI
jgi:hypothetical protein